MRNTFPYLLLALFSFYGCSDDVNCVEEPDDPDCVASCMDDPTLPGCGDMGPGDMGMGDAGPCGMCTGGDVCDEASGSCVACLGDGDCGDDVCLVDAADSANNECVGCVDSEDCSGALGTCDEENHECVGCLMDSDCDDPAMAKCDTGTNTCVECDSSTQCEGTGENECVAGACVECTEGTAETHCDDNSCNPATNECTETERGSVLDCGRCVGDAECMDTDARCVPMNYMGTERPDGYCLRLSSATCTRPYGTTLITAVSLSGEAEAEYCGIDQATTTCDAVRALRESRACTGGDVSLCANDGARCEMVGAFADRCTYSCGTPDQCPTGVTCDGEYCGS